MRKAIFMILLVVVSGTAAAWVAIADDQTRTDYVDPSTIRKTGNLVKMWDLIDFKVQQPPEHYLSVRTQREYDCKEEQYRVLFTDFYSGNMARGENVAHGSGRPGIWESVPPSTVGELEWKFACGKR